MKKQLLVDCITFNISTDMINESMEKNNGRLLVKGVLQRADAKNQNGRVYPKNILMREAKKYADINIKERRALGGSLLIIYLLYTLRLDYASLLKPNRSWLGVCPSLSDKCDQYLD